ncbi:MAG: DedA family protein [Actinomycetota bacterium]|jgi:membrane protein DedA with SNARE-associated domain|nr:DedA family protein [Actinomycetota bacterium]MCL6093907.1 DedA family protein [Actinomycetota bacterium]MDA8167175.1 DedA family protein [Actinomycetota bacterium]
MASSLIEFLANFVKDIISTLGYPGVFLAMAIESACIPLPSEVIMPFAGFLVYQDGRGLLALLLVAVVGALGNLAGSLLAYWVGARGGRPLVERYGRYVLLSHHDLDVADRWFARYGKGTVFSTRLMPVIRTFISFPAGISRMKLPTFSIYTFLGALPWSLFLAFVGFKLGANWDTLGGYFHKADIFIAIAVVAGVIWYVARHIRNLRRDGGSGTGVQPRGENQ